MVFDGRRGIGLILFDRCIDLILRFLNPVLIDIILKVTLSSLVTDRTIEGMFHQHELKDFSPQLPNLRGIGFDHHAIHGLCVAGGDRVLKTLNFYHTHPAEARWDEALHVAQRWDAESILVGNFQDGCAFFCLNSSAVNGNSHRDLLL